MMNLQLGRVQAFSPSSVDVDSLLFPTTVILKNSCKVPLYCLSLKYLRRAATGDATALPIYPIYLTKKVTFLENNEFFTNILNDFSKLEKHFMKILENGKSSKIVSFTIKSELKRVFLNRLNQVRILSTKE